MDPRQPQQFSSNFLHSWAFLRQGNRALSKPLLFILFVAAAAVLLTAGRLVGLVLDHRQIESLTIFAALILGILIFENHRLGFAFSALLLILLFGLLTIRQAVSAGLAVLMLVAMIASAVVGEVADRLDI